MKCHKRLEKASFSDVGVQKSEEKSNEYCKNERYERKTEGDGKTSANQFGNALIILIGNPEIAPERARNPQNITFRDRFVQTHFLLKGKNLRRIGIGTKNGKSGISRQNLENEKSQN